MKKNINIELLESRPLREWDEDLLPEDLIVFVEHCDEWSEPVVKVWRRSVETVFKKAA